MHSQLFWGKFFFNQLQTATKKMIRGLHNAILVEWNCSTSLLASFPHPPKPQDRPALNHVFSGLPHAIWERLGFFSLLSFSHPSIYVKVHCKQKVLCSCKLLLMFLSHVDLGAIPAWPEYASWRSLCCKQKKSLLLLIGRRQSSGSLDWVARPA